MPKVVRFAREYPKALAVAALPLAMMASGVSPAMAQTATAAEEVSEAVENSTAIVGGMSDHADTLKTTAFVLIGIVMAIVAVVAAHKLWKRLQNA